MIPQVPDTARRIFLKRSIQALAVAMAAPAIGLGTVAKAAALPDGMVFKHDDMVALEALAITLVPGGGPYSLGAVESGLARRMDMMAAGAGVDVAAGVLGGVRYVEVEGPGLTGKLGRFSALSAVERDEVLQAMLRAGGVARQIYAGLRELGLYAYYTDEACWEDIGYDGTLV